MTENSNPTQDSPDFSAAQMVRNLWPLLLLAVAHLPVLMSEYSNLWNKEHYQFYPLALISFGCYFYARRLPGRFHWRPICWALVALDACLLIYGSGLLWMLTGVGLNFSPIAGVVGFWLLVWAVCLACSDREVDWSLGYLILLPLITVRLPLNLDQDLILWLQKVTTIVSSELLNFFGYLHSRQGVILDFPGKRFEVENACSGVQSLFAVLFLAAFVTCGYRRRFLHTAIVISCGLLFAGFMNVVRISVIAIAWDTSRIDLSSGVSHDVIGYVALFAAALLVFSADAFLAFCFEPVPDRKGAGITAIYRNPITSLWNWFFKTRTRKQDEPEAVVPLPQQVWLASGLIASVLCVGCLIAQIRYSGFF